MHITHSINRGSGKRVDCGWKILTDNEDTTCDIICIPN